MKIFVSYPRTNEGFALAVVKQISGRGHRVRVSDKYFARSLAKQLTDLGHEVWVDFLALLPGDNWPLEIGKALQDCGAMVVLLSPHSASSDQQRREIDFALSSPQYAGRVIPVFMRPTKDYPWILDRFAAIRASDPAGTGKRIGQLLRKAS
jgi:hypothetical protein